MIGDDFSKIVDTATSRIMLMLPIRITRVSRLRHVQTYYTISAICLEGVRATLREIAGRLGTTVAQESPRIRHLVQIGVVQQSLRISPSRIGRATVYRPVMDMAILSSKERLPRKSPYEKASCSPIYRTRRIARKLNLSR